MAKPKRDYTINELKGTSAIHVYLNELDAELMVKILKVEGVIRCLAFSASALFEVELSLNYDYDELLREIKALLKSHFAPNNPVPESFTNAFDEPL